MPVAGRLTPQMYVRARCTVAAAAILLASVAAASAQSALSGQPIHISRAAGSITVDGDLSDDGWRNATRIEKWYEVEPGDNVEPKSTTWGI